MLALRGHIWWFDIVFLLFMAVNIIRNNEDCRKDKNYRRAYLFQYPPPHFPLDLYLEKESRKYYSCPPRPTGRHPSQWLNKKQTLFKDGLIVWHIPRYSITTYNRQPLLSCHFGLTVDLINKATQTWHPVRVICTPCLSGRVIFRVPRSYALTDGSMWVRLSSQLS